MLAHNTAAVHVGIGWLEQGSSSSPATADVNAVEAWEPSLHVVEEIALLLIGGHSCLRMAAGRVGCSDQCAPEEGQHEQHPAVIGGGQQQADALRTETLLQHQMHSTTGQHAFLALGFGHAPQRIGMNAGGVDHHAGLPALSLAIGVFADSCAQLPVAVFLQLHHRRPRAHDRPVLLGAECHQQVQPGIVKLPIAVGNPSADIAAQLGQRLVQQRPRQQPATADPCTA